MRLTLGARTLPKVEKLFQVGARFI